MCATTVGWWFRLAALVGAGLVFATSTASAQSSKAGTDRPSGSKADNKVVLPVILPEFSPSESQKPQYPAWLPENLPIPPGTPAWAPEAVIGAIASLLLGGLVVLSAWPLPKLPERALKAEDDQFCAEFLALPQKVQSILYQQLSQGERVIWAGKASSRLCRRNLGLVVFAGFSALSVIFANGRVDGWDGSLALLTMFVFCLTCFFAYLTLELPGIFMLTDRQAYALYQVPKGDFVFIYPPSQMAPVSVSKAFLLPKAGNVEFGNAKAMASRGDMPQGDPGPCGFQRIDDPALVAQLVEALLAKLASLSRIGSAPVSQASSASAARPEEMFRFE